MTQVSRRTLLAAGAATVVAANGLRWATADRSTTGPPGDLPDDPFTLGVCAGDPDASSAVLWTRLTAVDGAPLPAGDVVVTWELANDPTSPRRSRPVTPWPRPPTATACTWSSTSPVPPGTASAPARGPARSVASPRPSATRCASRPPTCQHFETGYYAAHRDIAEWAPDLVVFLGDFIYEGASQPVGGDRVRSHRGDEPRDLDAYRDRYAQYLGDADLQAARAAAPWLVIWDDHEVENNYAGLTSEDDDPVDVFRSRRLAAYQAWWEHMPVRIPRPRPDVDTIIYRTISCGTLADFILLDGRQFRSDQACGDVVLDLEPACPEASDPARTMLGTEQERWLDGQLAASAATWPVITQQTVVTDIRLPNGAVINYDQWDGYAPARDRMLVLGRRPHAAHDRAHRRHPPRRRRPTARRRDRVRVDVDLVERAGAGRLPGGRHRLPRVIGAELEHRGYTRHTVDATRWLAEFCIVDDVTDPSSVVQTWQSFAVDPSVRDAVTTVGAS